MNKEELLTKLEESEKSTNTLADFSNASKWFTSAVKRLDKEKSDIKRFTPGNLFTFYYYPKHKEKLPFFDTFPLVILLQKTKNGFLGLNLHYIPPKLRAKLLQALVKANLIVESRVTDDVIRFTLTYNILKGLQIFNFFKPCIKEYLFNNVKSRIILIKSDEWDNVINLPFEQFNKKDKQYVWNESIKESSKTKKEKTKINQIEKPSKED